LNSLENSKENKLYYKGLLESLVFLSSEPIKLSSLADSAGIEKSLTRELLDEIILEFQERNGGFLLKEIAGAYQFYTNEIYFKTLGTIFKEKRRETLSKSTLDTLAIVAYKQPITLPEIDDIRGVSSRAMVTTLIAKKLIKPIGQKEVPGRPTLYGTTSEFLIHFGLNKLSDLPAPGEVKELNFENLDDLKFKDEDEILSETDDFSEENSIDFDDSLEDEIEAPIETPNLSEEISIERNDENEHQNSNTIQNEKEESLSEDLKEIIPEMISVKEEI
jgi:segregation and condensation protein B